MFDVITIGSGVLDIYLRASGFKKIATTDIPGGTALCLPFGGKLETADLEVTTGGGATNTAVSFTRLGFNTAIVCELGQDLIGATIKEELRREQVNLDFVIEEVGEETGLSTILVTDDGGRAIAVYRGASKMLTVSDIPWEKLTAPWLYVTSLGGDVELLGSLIDHARSHQVKIAINPGKAEIDRLSPSKAKNLFAGIDVLLLNRQEAQALSGIPFDRDDVWKSEHCLIGPKTCVITDGKSGGKVCAQGKCAWFEAKAVTVVEETGAGDAFGSALVAALMKGKDIATAIDWGKTQSASVISFIGPKKGLLKLEQIENK